MNTVNLNPNASVAAPEAVAAASVGRRRWLAPAVGFVVGLVFLFVADPFLSPPDCTSYWAWGESVLRDLDLGFSNQYARYEMPRYYVYATGTGRLANDWPAGSGLALIPAMPFGRLAAQGWVAALAMGALALAVRSMAACAGGRVFAAVATLLGTPLFFYMACGPFFSHAVSFAVVTIFLVVWSGTLEERGRGEWLLLGVLLGAAALVRPQNAALAVVFLAEAPSLLRRRVAPDSISRFVVGTVLGFAPAMIGYLAIYGGPLSLPKSEEMHWLRPALWQVLASDYHGVLPWTPIHALGIGGLVVLARRKRTMALGFLMVFGAQLYLNASNLVWWCGGSFGNRRLVDVGIVVAFGLGALWEGSSGAGRRLLVGVSAVCVAWTCVLLLAERRLLVPLDRYVRFDGEFVRSLVTTLATPWETLAAVGRPFLADCGSPGTLAVRVLVSVVVGGVAWFLARRSLGSGGGVGPVPDRVCLGVAGGAFVVAVVVGIAAARTPPMPADVLASVGSEPRILYDNYVELAHYHVVRKETEQARRAALRALAIRPGMQAPLWYLARAAYDAGEFQAAREAAVRVLEVNPQHPGALDLMRNLPAEPSR